VLPAEAVSFVPGLTAAGLIEHDAGRQLVRLTVDRLKCIRPLVNLAEPGAPQ
jgi:hypothetical protein